jgi:hypothetical protein
MTTAEPGRRLPVVDRTMKARREGTCPLCNGPVRVGDLIARCCTTWYHASCVVRHITTRRPE